MGVLCKFQGVCITSCIHSKIHLPSGKMFCIMGVGRTRCISSHCDGGSEPTNYGLLLRFPRHYTLSLHLLYKYKHSGDEHKEEKKNMQICDLRKPYLCTPLEKNRAREMILKFHYKSGINEFLLLVNSALKYFFQAKSMIAVAINCGNKQNACSPVSKPGRKHILH